MDHHRANHLRQWYEYPKKVDEEIITIFKEELPDIVFDKIKEILSLQDELVRKRNIKLNTLKYAKNEENLSPDSWEATKYMWALITEIEFKEYYVLKKWLKYWLRLLSKSGNNIENMKLFNNDGFTEEQIQQAKDVPIEEMYEGNLRQIGARFVGKCPFHTEKTPSFTIFSNDNTFYCFGCHEHGDSLDFYSKINKVNFPEAVEVLLKYG